MKQSGGSGVVKMVKTKDKDEEKVDMPELDDNSSSLSSKSINELASIVKLNPINEPPTAEELYCVLFSNCELRRLQI